MKVLVIGESCTDTFVYGSSVRHDPATIAPIFVGEFHENSYGMASNVYRNILSIVAKKYSKDINDVKLVTNVSTRDYIVKTRYVINRKNQTLMRLDVGDKNYGHISEHIKDWKTSLELECYDGIVISDYNKGFLTEGDIEFILSKNKNTFLDTKKILGPWAKEVMFIKINNFEYDHSKLSMPQEMIDKLIVTVGSSGTMYKDEIFPVHKIEILNTCGAGDSHFSAFCLHYLKTKNVGASIKFANKIATIVVRKKGVSVPYDTEVT